MGRKRGRERRERRQGGVVSRARLSSLSRETKEAGWREMSTLQKALGVVNTHTEIATMIMLASMRTGYFAGVVTCVHLLWKYTFPFRRKAVKL